jgi:hypothetical protein
MNPLNVEPLRAVLMDRLLFQYGELRGEQMSKATFLHDLWRSLSSFTLNNKANSLVQDALCRTEHDDLVPRAFLILSVLYGSYDSARDEMSPLKDFIGMLGKDLDEEELRILAYAERKVHCFFPELRFVWRTIREIYGAEEFDLALLPPTPYHAYSLLVLNRPEIAFSPAHHDAVFNILVGLDLAHPVEKPILKVVK